jgi:predicted RNA-binding protein YlqC (UPF0109 family)
MEPKLKELVEYIAKSLVDSPDEVVVSEIDGEQTTIFELKVAQGDIGKIIGKQGRTARSIRNILSAAAMKHKKRAVLEILE